MSATQQQLQSNAQKRREKRRAMRGSSAANYSASDESTNVSNIVAEMLGKDSRLTQQAETQGLQTANRRGLLNSSMAAQASEAALLDRVVPMASQESDQRFTSRSATQKFGFDTELNDQQGEIQRGLADQKFGFDTALNTQEADIKRDLADQKYGFDTALKAQEGEIQRGIAQQEISGRLAIADRENETRLALEELNIQSKDKQAAADMISTSQDLYAGNIRDIRNNTNLSSEERNSLISAEQDNISLQYQLVEDLYGVDIKWPGTSGSEAVKQEQQPAGQETQASGQQQTQQQPQPQAPQTPQTQAQQNGAEIQWSPLSGRPNENWDR